MIFHDEVRGGGASHPHYGRHYLILLWLVVLAVCFCCLFVCFCCGCCLFCCCLCLFCCLFLFFDIVFVVFDNSLLLLLVFVIAVIVGTVVIVINCYCVVIIVVNGVVCFANVFGLFMLYLEVSVSWSYLLLGINLYILFSIFL